MTNTRHKAQSQQFKKWAQFQDKEIQQRQGDGYSAWEYMTDLPGALFNNASAEVSQRMNDEGYARGGEFHYPTDKMRSLLKDMRGIADRDKESPSRSRSQKERDAVSAWELMKLKGEVNY